MTIDERVESLIRALAHLRGKSGSVYEHELETYQKNLRFTLLEVARDQRHACAEAIAQTENANVYNRPETVSKNTEQPNQPKNEIEAALAELITIRPFMIWAITVGMAKTRENGTVKSKYIIVGARRGGENKFSAETLSEAMQKVKAYFNRTSKETTNL